MNKIALVFLLVGFTCVLTDSSSFFRNYRVYEVIENGANAPRLQISDDDDSIEVLKEYHVFDEDGHLKTVRSYLVPPEKETAFVEVLDIMGAHYRVSIFDLGARIQEEQGSLNKFSRRSKVASGFRTDSYYSYDEIAEYLKYISTIKHPKTKKPLAIVDKIGKSYEGRDMYLTKISTNHNAKKPIMFFEAGMHAREWMAPASALYMIHQLVENYTRTGNVLNNFDFYIIPVSNPDGYQYSRSTNRLWRKTRSKQGRAIGVDGNRNFDFHWGETGSSDDPKSEIFKGPRPFSEIETVHVRNVGKKYADRIRVFVSIHAYGPHILYPWGYAAVQARDVDKLDNVAQAFASTIRKINGTKYQVGPTPVLMYEAAGGADDYFKGVLGVDLSYTVELSSAGENSFIVPTHKIFGIVNEAFEGFRAMAEKVSRLASKCRKNC